MQILMHLFNIFKLFYTQTDGHALHNYIYARAHQIEWLKHLHNALLPYSSCFSRGRGGVGG